MMRGGNGFPAGLASLGAMAGGFGQGRNGTKEEVIQVIRAQFRSEIRQEFFKAVIREKARDLVDAKPIITSADLDRQVDALMQIDHDFLETKIKEFIDRIEAQEAAAAKDRLRTGISI